MFTHWRHHSGSKSMTHDAGLSAINILLPMRSGRVLDFHTIPITAKTTMKTQHYQPCDIYIKQHNDNRIYQTSTAINWCYDNEEIR